MSLVDYIGTVPPWESVIYDEVSSSLMYVGYSGSSDRPVSAKAWRIQRIRRLGAAVVVDWALNNSELAVWDNRSAYFPTPIFNNQNSLLFDGINDSLSVGTGYIYEMSQAWSLSVWLKPNNVAAQRVIYSRVTQDSNVYGVALYHQAGGTIMIQVRAAGQLGQWIATATTLTSGVWQHLCLTFAGNNRLDGMRLYLNGIVEVPISATVVSNTLSYGQPSYWGSRGSGFYYSGYMDEATIWSRVLSGSEVSTLYNGGSPTNPSSSLFANALYSYLRMGDNAAYPVIPDDGPAGISGTMLNMSAAAITTQVP